MDSTSNIRMRRVFVAGLLFFGSSLLPAGLSAQQTSDEKPPTPPPVELGVKMDSARKSADLPHTATTEDNKGDTWGVYETRQSAEFGGRISDFTGNQGTWDTYVNMGSGPRLLEYTLDMHSPTHNGLLFDDLTFSNFGYGGDPNDASHLRFSKGTTYSFSANFRRDQQVFDYNLLANPLNPATSSPDIPILNTPHEFLTTRRMSDANLSLFPLSKVQVKLGWSRVVVEGTTFSSTHQGTEGLVSQPTLTTQDTYTFGFSFRFIPRTAIHYDQFYTYYKGDTSGQLADPLQQSIFGIPTFTLAGGLPVNLGIPYNTAITSPQPCPTPVLGTGFANPACNGYFSYNRFGNNRNSYPTEQVSLQSNYFKRTDISARFSYTDGEAGTPSLGESFSGLITRTRQRDFTTLGSALAKRISMSGDFGITFRITDRLRLVDTFRYYNFRIPGGWNQTTNSLFGATLLSTANVFTLATCPPPFTAATCPQHGVPPSATPDIVNDLFSQFLGQEDTINTFEVEYDFTRRLTAYVGFRYELREITDNVSDFQIQTFFPTLAGRGGCTPSPVTGICTVAGPNAALSGSDFTGINGYSGIFGFAARPTNNLRFNFDMEQYWADNTFTRISPRRLQWYKARGSYKPVNWMNFSGALNIRENSNHADAIDNNQHNRSYAFAGVFAPPEGKWSLDLGYDYNDIFSQTNICFVATPTPVGSLTCPVATTFLSGISVYKELSNIVNGSIYFKPVRRVSLGAGYTLTSSTGSTLILNPNSPTGPLSFNYHLPTASLAIDITKHLTYKTGWNYYDYNEKSDPGPTLPRDFRGNTFTLSLRYSM